MGTEDETILREAINILHKSGSVEYAEGRARTMLEKAWARLEKSIPQNEGRDKLK